MEISNEDSLYTQIEEFTKQFTYTHIDGVSAEIQDFFRSSQKIFSSSPGLLINRTNVIGFLCN